MPRKRRNNKIILFAVVFIALIIGALIGYFYGEQIKQVGEQFKEFMAVSETEAGEKLVIKVRVGSSTQEKAASWFTSWFVNGTDYGDDLTLHNIDLSVQVDISGSKITNARIAECYWHCEEQADPAKYVDYYIVQSTSPVTVTLTNYQGSWSDSYNTDLDTHLLDMGLDTAPTGNVTYNVDYYFYVRVEADGEITGNILTAEIGLTKVAYIEYKYEVYESLSATASGTVTTSSWLQLNVTNIVIIGLTIIIVFLALKPRTARGRKRK